jgi:hypothetical protein
MTHSASPELALPPSLHIRVLAASLDSICREIRSLRSDMTAEDAFYAGFSDPILQALNFHLTFGDGEFPDYRLIEAAVDIAAVAYPLGGWRSFSSESVIPFVERLVMPIPRKDGQFLVHSDDLDELEAVIGKTRAVQLEAPVKWEPEYPLIRRRAPLGSRLITQAEHENPTICVHGDVVVADPCYLTGLESGDLKTGEPGEWVRQIGREMDAAHTGDGVYFGVAVDSGNLVRLPREMVEDLGIDLRGGILADKLAQHLRPEFR